MRIGLTKTYVIVAILSLGILYALSFGVLMGMETDSHGQMTACPFTKLPSICIMGFSEHIGMWQSVFTATLDNSVLLGILSLIVLALSSVLKYLDTSQDREFKEYKLYSHTHSNNSTFNKLLELFSGGILNPKIYELVAI